MPGRIEWDNEEKTILLNIYEGDLVLEDYYRVTDMTFEELNKLPHTVHTIMLRNVRKTPTNMSKVMQYANKKTPPNLGMSVIVGGSQFTRIIVKMAKVIAPKLSKEVYFADSLEEARQIIKEKSSDIAKTS
ncbi:MAG: hypothetical protein SFZ02_19030 [bacterium]|nr:hypothetical protein [bacterium]